MFSGTVSLTRLTVSAKPRSLRHYGPMHGLLMLLKYLLLKRLSPPEPATPAVLGLCCIRVDTECFTR